MSKIGTLIISVAEYFDVSTDQVTEDMVKKYKKLSGEANVSKA